MTFFDVLKLVAELVASLWLIWLAAIGLFVGVAYMIVVWRERR